MRKNYTYDEDDAIPIKTKRKKGPDTAVVKDAPKDLPARGRQYTASEMKTSSSNKGALTNTRGSSAVPADGGTRHAEKMPAVPADRRRENTPNLQRVPQTRASGRPQAKRPAAQVRSNSVRTHQSANESRSAKSPYKLAYLIFVALLLIISIGMITYVHGALVEYEASQPENILAGEISKLKEAHEKGTLGELIDESAIKEEFSAGDAEVGEFEKAFLEGNITFKENHDAVDPTKKVFDVISDGCKVATYTLGHTGQETKLLIFTLDRWSVDSFDVSGYEFSFTAPSSVIIKNFGEVMRGEKDETSAKTTYNIKTLEKPDIEICDVLGNSVKYDKNALPTFTDYKITIPSNFTVKGKETVPLSAAVLSEIDEYKYVKEYSDSLPDMATYIISIMSGEPDFKIYDNNGDEFQFELSGRKVKIEDQVGKNTLSIDTDFDPLDVAKLWSFFMTQDLEGKNNGYYKISPYLISGSYLQGVAWKWATGIDITFTSDHTLRNPPFCTEKVTNYIVYSDDCFSCDILLEKIMDLSTGMQVTDTINSTFYFVKYDDTDNGIDDAHWVLVDYKEIK